MTELSYKGKSGRSELLCSAENWQNYYKEGETLVDKDSIRQISTCNAALVTAAAINDQH